MIISTILDLPKVEPDDWDKWWAIWNTHSKVLKRNVITHNQEGKHIGLDIYKTNRFMPTYDAPSVNLSELYPSLFEQIMALPVDIFGVRFIHSFDHFVPHVDNLWPNWAIRNMFYCEDPNPQWYYVPKNSPDLTDARWLTLPPQSNWWSYLDGEVKHATRYSAKYPKILLQYFTRPSSAAKYVTTQFNKYPEHNIEFG